MRYFRHASTRIILAEFCQATRQLEAVKPNKGLPLQATTSSPLLSGLMSVIAEAKDF